MKTHVVRSGLEGGDNSGLRTCALMCLLSFHNSTILQQSHMAHFVKYSLGDILFPSLANSKY